MEKGGGNATAYQNCTGKQGRGGTKNEKQAGRIYNGSNIRLLKKKVKEKTKKQWGGKLKKAVEGQDLRKSKFE